MKALCASLLFAALGIAPVGLAKDEPEVLTTQMSRTEAAGLDRLPAHLKAAQDRLSLLADFQGAQEGWVSMYLVNRTKKAVVIPSQDRDVYCKRETKDGEGAWRRCDSHAYSWCGNSYESQELPANRLLSWQQKLDSPKGKVQLVRFRMFQEPLHDLISNEGPGRVLEASITFCRYDAMAMSSGSFEDVTAVATGTVKGSQGSSLGINTAMRALGRFYQEEGFFQAVKQTVDHLKKTHATNEFASREYDDCLDSLGKGIGVSLAPQSAWDYVAAQVNDPQFPWRSQALDWLGSHFDGKWREIEALTEPVLSQPQHPALASALRLYAKFADKDVSGPRLAKISQDASYSRDTRDRAREIRNDMLANPFLKIRAEQGDAFAEELSPLKWVSIANISPQEIVLPVAKAEDLLVLQLIGDDSFQMSARVSENGTLRLKPGEKVELRDVHWWKWVPPAMIKEGKSYSFLLMAASPGLWDVPAELGWWTGTDGTKLLKAIRKERGEK